MKTNNAKQTTMTYEFTQKEISLIKQALGIAEVEFLKFCRNGLDYVSVRGCEQADVEEQKSHNRFYLDKINEFAELNEKIR